MFHISEFMSPNGVECPFGHRLSDVLRYHDHQLSSLQDECTIKPFYQTDQAFLEAREKEEVLGCASKHCIMPLGLNKLRGIRSDSNFRAFCTTCQHILSGENKSTDDTVIQILQERPFFYTIYSASSSFYYMGHKTPTYNKDMTIQYKGVDIVIIIDGIVFFIELDSNFHQHQRYSNETERMIDYTEWGMMAGLKVVWIRVGYSDGEALSRRENRHYIEAIDIVICECLLNRDRLNVDEPLFFYPGYNNRFTKSKSRYDRVTEIRKEQITGKGKRVFIFEAKDCGNAVAEFLHTT